jgi:hypothetical protein
MSESTTAPSLPGVFRELTLTLLGVFEVYDVPPETTTAVARGLGEVFRTHLSEFPPDRAWKGRSALRAMVRDLDELTAPKGP